MIIRIMAVETYINPLLNPTGVSTELNLSHMVSPSWHLRGDRALSYSGPPDHSPLQRRRRKKIERM